MRKFPITILTATYNRRHTLPDLFESLKKQNDFDFQWLVIDDGSTDGTKEYIEGLTDYSFDLKYVWKENGGKHTALNCSHPYIEGEYVAMVDSDDYVADNTISRIKADIDKYHEMSDIAGFSYAKAYKNGKPISQNIEDGIISDYISLINNQGIGGDRFEVYLTEVFCRFDLPVFPNEKFMSEGWLHRNIAYDYKTVYFNEPLVFCEYLPGGYSVSGRKLLLSNPYGLMENCRSCFHPKVKYTFQIKEMILFGVYGMCTDMSWLEIAKYSGRPVREFLCLPFSKYFYNKWK